MIYQPSWKTQDTWSASLKPGAYSLTLHGDVEWLIESGIRVVEFDGSTTQANTTGFWPFSNVTAFSFCARVMIYDTPGALTRMIAGQYASATNGWAVGAQEGTRRLRLRMADGEDYYINLGDVLYIGILHSIAVTWNASVDGGKPRLYVDGSETIGNNGMTTPLVADAEFMLGMITNVVGSGYHWYGCIGDVVLYDRMLSAEEVWQYTRRAIPTGHLVYYPFSEGSGTTLHPSAFGWRHQDYLETAVYGGSIESVGWKTIQRVMATFTVPEVPEPDLSAVVPFWASFAGLVMLPFTACYLPLKKRLGHDLDLDDVAVTVFMFMAALALILGGV